MQQPGRPREFVPNEILYKIMLLFWENGYEGTGLSDIMAATGIGKASLYSAFGNKQQMYLKALAHYEALVVESAVKSLGASDTRPSERIEAFLSSPIRAVRDNADHRGCFLCNAAADRASLDPEADALVLRGYEKLRRAIGKTLKDMNAARSAAELEQLSQLLLTVYSGLRIMARSGMPYKQLELAKDAVLTMT